MRALKLASPPDPSQESDALRRWASRRRELLLEDRLDALVAILERLVGALERRAS